MHESAELSTKMLRRYVELYGLNLYPSTPGEQICMPVPEQERVGAL